MVVMKLVKALSELELYQLLSSEVWRFGVTFVRNTTVC